MADIGEIASLGGKAAAANMTPEQRSERARKGARGRWGVDELRAVVVPATPPKLYTITESELLDCALSALSTHGGDGQMGTMREFSRLLRIHIVAQRVK